MAKRRSEREVGPSVQRKRDLAAIALIRSSGILNPNAKLEEVLKLSGTLAGLPRYFLMIDPARLIPPTGGKSVAADQMIQDFGVSVPFGQGFELTALLCAACLALLSAAVFVGSRRTPREGGLVPGAS